MFRSLAKDPWSGRAPGKRKDVDPLDLLSDGSDVRYRSKQMTFLIPCAGPSRSS
jgi:hypothetical protein